MAWMDGNVPLPPLFVLDKHVAPGGALLYANAGAGALARLQV
jgi:hypothetical protein